MSDLLQVTVACPFCQGTITAGEISDTCGVMHTQPTCKQFNELDPVTFLTAVNTEIRSKLGVGYG